MAQAPPGWRAYPLHAEPGDLCALWVPGLQAAGTLDPTRGPRGTLQRTVIACGFG
jgi:hypothetical protein